MDLIASYASSDEEEEEESPQNQKQNPSNFKPSKPSTEIPSRLPENDDDNDADFLSVNKPSSTFSLPPPKFSSSLLSSLPVPKSSRADPFHLRPASLASSEPKLKKVVQFRPPSISSWVNDNSVGEDDEEEEDEDEKEKRRKLSESTMENRSVKSFLSSLPAPKSSGTLGSLSLGSGTGRKSILEADVPASDSNGSILGTEVGIDSNMGCYENQYVQGSNLSSSGAVDGGFQLGSVGTVGGEGGYTQGGDYSSYQGYTGYGEHSGWVGHDGEQYSNYASGYETCGQYENNWVDKSNASAQELPESAESALRVTGKRRKNDAPPEIVEVNQDELMKNRPREDQSKLTGIAFGPSYQPASTKGKPSKLLKRKHQISSLYFDMRQKESELAERRSRGMLTKAQTQGKYGW
ncbi:unnamed protein product [Cuscuta epithymum]|uniref:Proline-rich protein PRCC n=1 Tax=Cuscuta epithymum TaxID=186058 RepID=A0AAV0FST6_9ASTE|nr:unnamed protein product [Cuscuta epithymum]